MIDFRLYLITDRKLFGNIDSMMQAIEEALKGGVKAVQLREKDLGVRELLGMAYRMRELTKEYGARLFINDRVDVAMAAGADGVHLGFSGIPAYAAKKAGGRNFFVGVSTHSMEEAKKAVDEGADFITFGPVYETPSKMKYGRPVGIEALREAASEVKIPVFAIGGINAERAAHVRNAGAYGAAVISAVLASGDVMNKTKELTRLLQ